MTGISDQSQLDALQVDWSSHWEQALRCWSPYIQLSQPIWCHDEKDERQEGLIGSFAMIRLLDHRVVISLRQIAQKQLQPFATEILAHEIGHHVYCPADLNDNARVLVRLRAGLPTKEHLAPFIGNLYEDLLINDRLQRFAHLHMADVYRKLDVNSTDPLWLLYMRTYEQLWQLPAGTLAKAGAIDARISTDAQLAARLIRSYAKDWVAGASRFAALCLPYLLKDEAKGAQNEHRVWNDTKDAGKGSLPDGLAEIEPGETDVVHPAEDPELSGLDAADDVSESDAVGAQPTSPQSSGQKKMKDYRGPVEYTQIVKAAAGNLADQAIIARYYRERAMPHLIRFPVRNTPAATDPTPEGLETWDIGSPLQAIDWMGTLLASPTILPGFTTRERVYGSAPGSSEEKTPVDLYLGVDCSGSMGNPATQLSYPILAGAIIALSALRAGSKVMVALSGEPGKTITTGGFGRNETLILNTLTAYLGTGTTFGIHRLAEVFALPNPNRRPIHILIITDNDIFSMLERSANSREGWDVARVAAVNARGGATYVLQLPGYLMNQAAARRIIPAGEERMMRDGWNVAHVDSMDEIVAFAKDFSRTSYGSGPVRKTNAT